MGLKKTYKFDEATLESAKTLYMGYTTLSEITKQSKVPRSALLYYIPKWREERERMKSEVIDALTDSKRDLMYSIAKSGLEILNKSMIELSKSTRTLTPREMTGIAAIIDNLDKITKLDEGKPTQITGELKPANVIEMRKLLLNDPFLSEIDYVEVVDPMLPVPKP